MATALFHNVLPAVEQSNMIWHLLPQSNMMQHPIGQSKHDTRFNRTINKMGHSTEQSNLNDTQKNKHYITSKKTRNITLFTPEQ